MNFNEGDTVKSTIKSLVTNKRFLNEKGFIIAMSDVKAFTFRVYNNKFVLFSNYKYELTRTRIILIEKNVI